jgi:plasmid stabilization system protein ParE
VTRVQFVSAALADVEDARQWYDAQRPGLGDDFLDAFEGAVDSVAAFPTAYPVQYRDVRRFLLERFPYCLYYRVASDGVIVLACMHAVRSPIRIRRRLRE